MRSVLILTTDGDWHAAIVHRCLLKLGVDAHIYSVTTLLGRGDLSIKVSAAGQIGLHIGDQIWPAEALAQMTIWKRRGARGFILPANADVADEYYLSTNAAEAERAIYAATGTGFCVNPHDDPVRLSKVSQLRSAAVAGLQSPETVVSNRFDDIQSFLRQGGESCFKPFVTGFWTDGTALVRSLTERISYVDGASRASVELMPHIYQKYVEKAFEVRVFAFGLTLIASRIDSQADQATSTDWRASSVYRQQLSPIHVPVDIQNSIWALLKDLGLRMGSLDFVVTPEGEWVFLEVNPQGQFLWQEEHCPGVRVVEPFARYLAAADDLFVVDVEQPGDPELRFERLLADILESSDYADFLAAPPGPDENVRPTPDDLGSA